MKADVIIIGAGLAGTASAAALAKAGREVALIDARDVYPPEFRAEKFGPVQMAHLERMGLAEAAMAQVTRHESVRIARFGHIVAEGKDVEYGFHYADLVNGVRAALPDRVRRILGRVSDIATGPERQSVTMTDGTQVEGRLLIVATGSGDAIRSKAGIGRTVLSPSHSLVFGFSLEAAPGFYPFESLCVYGKGPADRISYIGIFRIGDEMRVNLFVYRTLDDPWTQRFRAAPTETLLETMPELARLCGELKVKGGVAVRPIDLVMAADYRRDGVVLVGDGGYAESADEELRFGRRVRGPEVDKRLRQRVRAAPQADPERTGVIALDRLPKRLRSSRCLALAGRTDAIRRLAGKDSAFERCCLGPALRMQLKIGADLAVNADNCVHGLGMCSTLLPHRGGGDHRLEIHLVRVEQEADEGHLIVGLVADVADDDDTGMAHEAVDWRRFARLRQRPDGHHGAGKNDCQICR